MKNDKLSFLLNQQAEKAIPSAQIDLWPAIKDSLGANQSKNKPGERTVKQFLPQSRLLRGATYGVLFLMIAAAILLVTPQGRTLAQNMFQFFIVSDNDSFVVPTDQVFSVPETSTPVPTYVLPLEAVEEGTQPEPTETSSSSPLQPVEEEIQSEGMEPVGSTCDAPASQSDYYCQIRAVEAQAGFDLKEFYSDPKGTEFSKVTFNAANNQVSMEFVVSSGGGYLYLRQGRFDYVPADDEWSKVPSEAVEQVTVNGQYAEIASGTYVVYPDAASAVWEPGGRLSLVWREGERWFVLEKMGDPYPIEWITKEEMVRLAESLVDERPADAIPPQDPENLKSVAEAEALAGFDVPEPAVLPKGYELKRVMWVYETVRLLYGQKNSSGSSMTIAMGPVEQNQVGPCLDCPAGTDEVVQVGVWQGWYWLGIYHTGPSEAGKPTPTAEWQADARNWVLAWNTDRLWISISFWPDDNGEEMDKDTLIAIAESMK